MSRAEVLLGSRDTTKKLYQPTFRDDGPILINTPNCDGAFAAMSRNAAGYWPTVVFEMAHETVHLLDPIQGYTTWLEEGAAVAFSVEMSRLLTSHPMNPDPASAYGEALLLVQKLPAPVFQSIRNIRAAAGRLADVKPSHILGLFPMLYESVGNKLAEKCIPR